jgi:3'-5' exoribonuclease
LADKTGSIEARIWENAAAIEESLKVREVVLATARADEYQGQVQLQIERLRKCSAGEYSVADFMPSTPADVRELAKFLKERVESIGRVHLKRLLEMVLLEDEEVRIRFAECPAAERLHQNYLGGLMEHTAAVTDICTFVTQKYTGLDRDMLLTAAILHDIGKTREYAWDVAIGRTDGGELLGHVVMGYEMVMKKAAEIEDFPEMDRILLGHAILSHHGAYEWGSPKLPMTAEAMVLHLVENIDAQFHNIQQSTEAARKQGKRWTEWDRMFERKWYVGEARDGTEGSEE